MLPSVFMFRGQGDQRVMVGPSTVAVVPARVTNRARCGRLLLPVQGNHVSIIVVAAILVSVFTLRVVAIIITIIIRICIHIYIVGTRVCVVIRIRRIDVLVIVVVAIVTVIVIGRVREQS